MQWSFGSPHHHCEASASPKSPTPSSSCASSFLRVSSTSRSLRPWSPQSHSHQSIVPPLASIASKPNIGNASCVWAFIAYWMNGSTAAQPRQRGLDRAIAHLVVGLLDSFGFESTATHFRQEAQQSGLLDRESALDNSSSLIRHLEEEPRLVHLLSFIVDSRGTESKACGLLRLVEAYLQLRIDEAAQKSAIDRFGSTQFTRTLLTSVLHLAHHASAMLPSDNGSRPSTATPQAQRRVLPKSAPQSTVREISSRLYASIQRQKANSTAKTLDNTAASAKRRAGRPRKHPRPSLTQEEMDSQMNAGSPEPERPDELSLPEFFNDLDVPDTFDPNHTLFIDLPVSLQFEPDTPASSAAPDDGRREFTLNLALNPEQIAQAANQLQNGDDSVLEESMTRMLASAVQTDGSSPFANLNFSRLQTPVAANQHQSRERINPDALRSRRRLNAFDSDNSASEFEHASAAEQHVAKRSRLASTSAGVNATTSSSTTEPVLTSSSSLAAQSLVNLDNGTDCNQTSSDSVARNASDDHEPDAVGRYCNPPIDEVKNRLGSLNVDLFLNTLDEAA